MKFKPFLLKKLGFLLFIGLTWSMCPGILSAQVDTTFYPPSDTINPYPFTPSAILSPYNETGQIEAFSTAEFQTHTRLYVRMRNLAGVNFKLELSGATKLVQSFTQRTDGKWELDVNLPSNRNGDIVAYDNGERILLNNFNTSHNVRSVFEASQELMDLLSSWESTSPNTPLVSYITNSSTINIVEKLDYIQFHFYKDAYLPNTFVNTLPTDSTPFPSDVGSGGGRENKCICSFVVHVKSVLSPGEATPDGQITPIFGTSGKEIVGDWENWRDFSFEGLPRFYQQFSQGRSDGEVERTQNAGISYFSLRHLYNCSNSPDKLPEGCDCEVPINYNWKYESELDARAEIRSCLACGTREAETKVDDIVFAFFSDNKGNYEELGGNAGTAWASDNKPQSKIEKLILPVASIIVNIVGIAATGGIKAVVAAKLAVDIAKVVSVLTTPGTTPGKTPSNKASNDILSAGGFGQIKIKPNTLSEITVTSITAHAFKNRKRFYTWNRVLSSGYVQAVIEGGPLGVPGENDNCCVPHVTQYAQASFSNRLTSSNMLNSMNGNTGNALPDITNQIGYLTTPFAGCAVTVEGREDNRNTSFYANQTSFVIEKEFKHAFQFELYDLNGRLLATGKQLSNVINLESLDLINGIYLLRAFNQEINKSFRFAHFQ